MSPNFNSELYRQPPFKVLHRYNQSNTMAANRSPQARLVQALHKILRDEGYQCIGTGDDASQNRTDNNMDVLPVCLY